MATKTHCEQCGRAYQAQRSDSRFCGAVCRNIAKHARDNGQPEHAHKRALASVGTQLETLLNEVFRQHGQYSAEYILSVIEDIDQIRHTLNKIDSNVMSVQAEYNNHWFECTQCGQKTFGRVSICAFCEGDEFRMIK